MQAPSQIPHIVKLIIALSEQSFQFSDIIVVTKIAELDEEI